MYGKLFASTYSGSMYGAGPCVFAIWGWCIANSDAGGQVEINPALLANALGCSINEVDESIGYLLAPDPRSRNMEHDGRRLIHLKAYTYEIVSYKIYRDIRNAEERREYNRLKQQEHRARVRDSNAGSVIDRFLTDYDSQPKSAVSAKGEVIEEEYSPISPLSVKVTAGTAKQLRNAVNVIISKSGHGGRQIRDALVDVIPSKLRTEQDLDSRIDVYADRLHRYVQALNNGHLGKFALAAGRAIGEGLLDIDPALWPWKDGYGPDGETQKCKTQYDLDADAQLAERRRRLEGLK